MYSRFTIKWLLLLIFAVATLSFAYAQKAEPQGPPSTGDEEMGQQGPPPQPGPMQGDAPRPFDLPGKWWKNQRVVDDLQLTAEQVTKIESIFIEHRKKLIDLKARLEKGLIDLRELLEQADFKREQALRLQEEVSTARAEMARATMIMALDIRDQLTPTQRTELKKLQDKFKQGIRDRGVDRPMRQRLQEMRRLRAR